MGFLWSNGMLALGRSKGEHIVCRHKRTGAQVIIRHDGVFHDRLTITVEGDGWVLSAALDYRRKVKVWLADQWVEIANLRTGQVCQQSRIGIEADMSIDILRRDAIKTGPSVDRSIADMQSLTPPDGSEVAA
jgi:sRNA-binding carbon storage regulator CsrA